MPIAAVPDQDPLLPGPFISYSRQDLAFARKLYEALRRRKRDAWVDLEGIEPSEEWLKKLHRAIDASQAFVFVISEAAVSSRYCEDEIRRAAENNKKLIPILYRPVAPERLPAELAKLQWISFADEQSFESSVDDLIRALDTDLDWVNAHTRLLVRAQEWDREARDRSYLLRGKDLKDAEQWLLASAQTKERQPSALHSAYIGASAAGQRRSRNRLLVAVSAAAIVAVTLALVALFQRNQAERNERRAVSRLLAAQATGGKERDLNLSLLLAVAAYRQAPTFEARQSLRSVIEARPHLAKYLYGHGQRIQGLMFDSSGTKLLSSSDGGEVILWNVASGKKLTRIRVEGNAPPVVAMNAEATVIAVANASGGIRLHDVAGNVVREIPTQKDTRVGAIAFSPDGLRLAWGGDGRRIAVWQIQTQALHCVSGDTHKASLTALRFDATGRWLAATDYSGMAILWDSDSCETSSVLEADGGGPFAAISSDLTQIAVTDAGIPEVLIGNVPLQSSKRLPVDHGDFLLALEFHPRGEVIALGTRDAAVLIWDPRTGKTPRTLRGHRSDVTRVAFDPGGTRVASGSIHGEVIVWDLNTTWPMETARLLPQRAVSSVFFTQTGDTLLAASRDGRIHAWALNGAASTPVQIEWPATVTDLAVSPDGRLAAGRAGSRLLVQSIDGGAIADELPLSSAGEAPLRFSPDSAHLAFSDQGSVYLRDIAARNTTRAGDTTSDKPALAFASSGDAFAFTSAADVVSLVDLRNNKTSRLPVPGHVSGVRSVALNPDGTILASGGGMYDGNIILWKRADGRRLRVLQPEDPTEVVTVSFSPDGETLATVTAFSDMLRLWDVASGRLLGSPQKLSDSLDGETVAFSPDGGLLAMAKEEHIALRSLDPETALLAICKTVNRGLNEDEWNDYVGTGNYQPLCP